MRFSDQKYEDCEVSEDNFLFDITTVPGSSDDVAQLAIKHYHWLANNPYIPEDFRNIARAMEGNLQEYRNLSNLSSDTLRLALPHLSLSTRFMEAQRSREMDIEPSRSYQVFL